MRSKGRHRRRHPVRAAAALAAAIVIAGSGTAWALGGGQRHAAAPQPSPAAQVTTQRHTPPRKPPAARPAITDVRTYVVRDGDTLSSIAKDQCGTPKWGPLWQANRNVIPDPNMIKKNEVLVVAC